MLSIKLLGAGLVLLSGYLAGKVAKGAWCQRERQLGQLKDAMGALATEMNCLLLPLPQIMSKLAGRLPSPVGELFATAAEIMESGGGQSAQEAWEEAVARVGEKLSFLESDLAALSSLGAYLGASDLADQLKRLGGLVEQLEEQRQAAREAIGKEGKLVGFAWPSVAAVVVILFW